MLVAQKTVKDDGMRTHLICTYRNTINDDDATTHTTYVAERPNRYMEIGDTAMRPFTQVTAMVMNADNGKGMPQRHPALYTFK